MDKPRIILLTAMKRELGPLLHKLGCTGRWREKELLIYRIHQRRFDMLIVESGMGRRQTEIAARFVVERLHPHIVVCCGFGGGLTRGRAPGSVLCAERVAFYDEKTGSIGEPLPIPRSEVGLQMPDVEMGTVITADQPPDKKRLASLLPASFHPAVVDMETYYAAQIFLQAAVPFLSVRSVCDELEYEPGLDLELLLNRSGRIDFRRICAYALADPKRIARFFHLARRSALAARSLCQRLANFYYETPFSR